MSDPLVEEEMDYAPIAADVLAAPDFPEDDDQGPRLMGGVDYERWTPLCRPAPRGAFADTADFLEFLDD